MGKLVVERPLAAPRAFVQSRSRQTCRQLGDRLRLLRQLSQDVVDRARSVIHETRILRAASLIREDTMPSMEIIQLGAGDVDTVIAAADLFDEQPRRDATARFLAEPGHHLLLAYDGSTPIGFVSGIETVHPDKGAEMFLYELGVAESHRRRGVGRALVERLAGIARSLDCYGMWVATDDANTAALATYEAAGASRDDQPAVILTWSFREP